MFALAVVAVTVAMRAAADIPPSAPCGETLPQPSYAAIGAAPNVQIWKDQALQVSCLGWMNSHFRTLIAVSGTFAFAEDGTALLSRFGEISKLLGIRYWSTTDQAWRPLVIAATALSSFVAGRPRDDFSAVELQSGQDVYFSQKDNRGAGDVVYRMHVHESNSDRLIIETENATSVRLWLLTLFNPGDLHSVYFLDQRSPGLWSFYTLTKVTDGSWFVQGHENSYINRTVSLYRHIAGIPTDLEPPPAR